MTESTTNRAIRRLRPRGGRSDQPADAGALGVDRQSLTRHEEHGMKGTVKPLA